MLSQRVKRNLTWILCRCVLLLAIAITAGNGYAHNCAGICEISDHLKTAILSTGCAAPEADKDYVKNVLNELEAVLIETLDKIRDNSDSQFSTIEVEQFLDDARRLSQLTEENFVSRVIHHELEEMRLQLAGLKISKGIVCFSDFVWVLHEAFHPAMGIARHSDSSSSNYSDEEWKRAASSIKMARKVVTVLRALGSERNNSQEIVFFVQRISKALDSMDDAVQKTSGELFRESANTLHSSFLDLARIDD